MHFGGYTSEEEAFRIMDKCLDMGINFFDTANVYGGASGRGASEAIIGRWFQQGNGRRGTLASASSHTCRWRAGC
jgi:aryl-alcohol dehydrogenase-like predicted oxidoreductase